MKFTRHSNGSLEITETWSLLRTGCAIGGILMVAAIWYAEFGQVTPHLGKLAGFTLGGISLLGLAAYMHDRHYFFNVSEQALLWNEKNWFRARTGRLQFSEIKDVLVTSRRSLEESRRYTVAYSIALVTHTGMMPLTSTEGPNKQEYENIAAMLRATLRLPSKAPGGDSEIESLIASGRIIDAVTLIRASKGLDLTEAKALVDQIQEAQRRKDQ